LRKKRALTTENTESTEAFFKDFLRALCDLCGKKVFKKQSLIERSIKMKTVSVLELKAKAGELVRSVMKTGEEVQIIDNGEVVALLVSTDEVKKKEIAGIWTTLDQIASEINKGRG
jgi:prevent-host-death family protein